MIRKEDARVVAVENGKALEMATFYGLEDDTKPTEALATGCWFIEVDTGNVSLFDEVSGDWTFMFTFKE